MGALGDIPRHTGQSVPHPIVSSTHICTYARTYAHTHTHSLTRSHYSPHTSSPPKEPTKELSLERQQSSDQLLTSFQSFISSFELHMKLHGHEAPLHPDHIAGVLAELQTSSKSEDTNHLPPPYSEAVSVMVTTHMQSTSSDSNSEVIRLRRENEELRQLQLDREKLNTQLVEAQSKLEQYVVDLEMVTDECKKAKEELVVYKQVLERQQETLESVLSENFDLRKRLGIV